MQDCMVGRYVRLLRTLGLMRRQDDRFVLTDRALTNGSSTTKQIAMSTLIKMNEVLREGTTPGLEMVGQQQADACMVDADVIVPSMNPSDH